MKSNRAVIPVYVLWVIGGLAATQLVPNWRPSALFAPKPPTAALIQAQADLQKAKDEARIAQEALEAAKASESARKASQLSYGYQMTYGASEALKTAPASPQTALAVSLLSRSNTALSAAVGSLPQDKQNEILLIVSQSLSGAAEDLAKANATLAIRDRELAVATAERSALQIQIPALQTALETKTKQVEGQSAIVAEKTASVVTFAQKLADEKQQSGSISSLVGNLWRTVEIMGVLAAIGYGAFLWVRYKYGGIPQALGKGLAELRSKNPEAAALATSIFDTNLNRHEQDAIAQHAKV